MLITNYLTDNNITKYQLSKMTGLPYNTLNDIIKGKTDIAKCTGKTLLNSQIRSDVQSMIFYLSDSVHLH